MLLEEWENKLLAVLIGLVNGLEADNKYYLAEKEIREALDFLKNKVDDNNIIDKLRRKKEELLKDCLTCSCPCGRSFDYYLNAIKDPNEKEDKINSYKEFLKNLNKNTTIDQIVYNICKLTW